MKSIYRYFVLASLLCLMVGCSAESDTVVVKPTEIDSMLVNPGRGFTTTGGTFNDEIEGKRHPQSGVIQMRWYWDELEPKEGEINFTMIDSVLAEAEENGQQLNFRVMTQNVKMRIPHWAMDKGIEKPYYDNPVFLQKQADLIKALADRYDGNPNIAFVDIGSVGQWGEWHTTKEDQGIGMPSVENAKKVVDTYVKNFQKSPLVMLIGGDEAYDYALSKGTGWRADCWGDMGDRWSHMKESYPEIFSNAEHSDDAWKNGPIALETCWTMDKWYEEDWDIDYSLLKALEWHATSVNNGSQEIPQEWWSKVEKFEKQLGYRFVLNKLRYPSTTVSGENISYEMQWENVGEAPIYNKYPLAFRFRSAKDPTDSFIVKTDVDITKWMPGEKTVESNLQIPKEMSQGRYNVALVILKPGTKKPFIKLAIDGKTKDGWYNMGEIKVNN